MSKLSPNFPVLAVTMGDPAGIGPEIVAKALLGKDRPARATFVIVGDARALEKACRVIHIKHRPRLAGGNEDWRKTGPGVWLLPEGRLGTFRMGQAQAACGKAAMRYVKRAAELALAGRVDGMVTAPLSKEAMHKAGSRYEGHTDMLAALAGAKHVRMMFLGPSMNVILVTIHMALRKVPSTLDSQKVFDTIRMGAQALCKSGVKNPRIVVCGLNPHAGEDGAFGKEDKQIIRPAVLAAARLGWDVRGPVAADGFFGSAAWRKTDLIVAMYHDQGLIPFKLLHFDKGVNSTVGLPFVRTSPDHGTAFDIAGKGVADHGSMLAALRAAMRMS